MTMDVIKESTTEVDHEANRRFDRTLDPPTDSLSSTLFFSFIRISRSRLYDAGFTTRRNGTTISREISAIAEIFAEREKSQNGRRRSA